VPGGRSPDPDPGPTLRAELTRAVDTWLTEILGDAGAGVALVATGAYGRREPAPSSDLDLMLLHRRPASELATLAEGIWRPIWDSGMRLDHSVRTIEQAVTVGEADLKTALGLLDARLVAGDADLVAELREEWLRRWRSRARERLRELRDATRRRAERHGELAFLLEPDLKEARGGLRDGHAVRAISATWVAAGLNRRGQAAYDLLLDTRQTLHLVLLERNGGQVGSARAAVDRLSLQEQDAVAARLGRDGPEPLMRAVHEAGRTLARALDESWRRVDAVYAGPPVRRWRRPVRRPLGGEAVSYDGEVLLAAGADLADRPWVALEVAAEAARAGMPLAPQTLRRLEARPVSLPEPWPARAREAMVALIGAGDSAIGVIEALDQAGVMGALLPEWDRVRCKPQRNPFHRWTVDRHLVETAVHAAGLVRGVGRPDLLLLAALLHDLGKGWPGDHASTGSRLAETIGRRLGLPELDVEVVAGLVRNHLLLVDTATRRDLDDPATVRAVADAVGDPATLTLLRALTEADARATGPTAWTPWKARLVDELVRRVADRLEGRLGTAAQPPAPGRETATDRPSPTRPTADDLAPGAAAQPPAPGPATARPSPTTDETAPDRPSPTRPTADDLVPDRPSLSTDRTRGTSEEAPDLSASAGSGELELRVEEEGVTVIAPDRSGLLWRVAGVLALHRLDVRAATVSTERGTAVVSVSAQPRHGREPNWRLLADDLRRALEDRLPLERRLAEREAAYRQPAPLRPPPRVLFDDRASDLATVVEVRCADGPAVLYRITKALDAAGARVRSARIATYGVAVVDAFYVLGPDGGRLEAPADRAALVAEVLGTLRDDG
jgi:[protein-PII] uridylyltransferase